MGKTYTAAQRSAKEKHIYDAALRLCMEKDFSEITMRELARACGMGNGTIFNFFPTKEALYRKLLYSQYYEYFCSELARLDAARLTCPADYKQFILDGVTELQQEHPMLLSLLALHHNVFFLPDEDDALRESFMKSLDSLMAVGKATHKKIPALPETECVRTYFFLNAVFVGYRNISSSTKLWYDDSGPLVMGDVNRRNEEVYRVVARYLDGLLSGL